jgi:alpha-beta hydrolase superfamily lysophospholipase
MKTLIGLLFFLILTSNSLAQWKSDELGDDYEQMQLQFPDDYEGKVIATLVHKKSELPDSAQAILYVHGFSDYFFQTHMADYFTEQGYHFYAVDLRKYGRSHLEGQKWFNVRDLHEYFPEIDSSLAIIQAQVSGNICLMGHSTGGLITALYAAEHQDSKTFSSLILNSPFFDMNLSTFTENVLVPIGEFNGSFLPDMVLEGELAVYYNHSIHKDYKGEWNYRFDYKPLDAPAVTLGWIRAIRQGQKTVQNGIKINQPVLILHSDKTIFDKSWSDVFFTGDAVLDVEDIKKYSKSISGPISIIEIPNAMHDVILSKSPVRDSAFATMKTFIERNN